MTRREYRVVLWNEEGSEGAPKTVECYPRDDQIVQSFEGVAPHASLNVAGGMGWEVVQYDASSFGRVTLVLTRVEA